MHNLTSERTIYTQNNSAQNKYAELNLLDFGQNFITRKTIVPHTYLKRSEVSY